MDKYLNYATFDVRFILFYVSCFSKVSRKTKCKPHFVAIAQPKQAIFKVLWLSSDT